MHWEQVDSLCKNMLLPYVNESCDDPFQSSADYSEIEDDD